MVPHPHVFPTSTFTSTNRTHYTSLPIFFQQQPQPTLQAQFLAHNLVFSFIINDRRGASSPTIGLGWIWDERTNALFESYTLLVNVHFTFYWLFRRTVDALQGTPPSTFPTITANLSRLVIKHKFDNSDSIIVQGGVLEPVMTKQQV